ncbi:hypothetical protein LSUE1_G004355 [Lachnellula suecica]|uniref:DUF1996 domain-containing protein n=1 Tax=Lachnellula suecica TaxID=602035 RepID=A0A8T9C6C0_9HELO|nr:hypothetical protein LSUE1_G004355 [Lachnellula suecica]
MQWKTLLPLSLALSARATHKNSTAQDMLRFACSQLVVERLDPIVQPGVNGSAHLHQIVGGNSFNISMPTTDDPMALSTCTSCSYSEDLSNYWTAVLYFRARNGTFKRVSQVANGGLVQRGGITVYYITPYDGVSNVTSFLPGFRMLVGSPFNRNEAAVPYQVCHRCFGSIPVDPANPYGGRPCLGDDDTAGLPAIPCPEGIRTTITFPTCWDGTSLDSADHKSHIVYPTNGTFETNGPCPSTHPMRTPQVMYEVMWGTQEFNDASLWPVDGSQPFVYSMGDPTGFGSHADYLFGWKGDALQRALDARCNIMYPEDCPLAVQSDDTAMACTQPAVVHEPVDGWLAALPGNNPVSA